MPFIKLTAKTKGPDQFVFVQSHTITSIGESSMEDCSYVSFSGDVGNYVKVVETPEEIINLIEKEQS